MNRGCQGPEEATSRKDGNCQVKSTEAHLQHPGKNVWHFRAAATGKELQTLVEAATMVVMNHRIGTTLLTIVWLRSGLPFPKSVEFRNCYKSGHWGSKHNRVMCREIHRQRQADTADDGAIKELNGIESGGQFVVYGGHVPLKKSEEEIITHINCNMWLIGTKCDHITESVNARNHDLHVHYNDRRKQLIVTADHGHDRPTVRN